MLALCIVQRLSDTTQLFFFDSKTFSGLSEATIASQSDAASRQSLAHFLGSAVVNNDWQRFVQRSSTISKQLESCAEVVFFSVIRKFWKVRIKH